MDVSTWLSGLYVEAITVPLWALLLLAGGVVVGIVCCVRCNASMKQSAWRMRHAHEGLSEEGRSLLSSLRVAEVLNQGRRDHLRGGGGGVGGGRWGGAVSF